MAYEFLKKLFGTQKDGEEPKAMTYAELEAAIDADKKIQVVDVKAGGYVSKEKLDAKITELDGVRQQLTDANAEIKSYKEMDIDGIKKSAKDWEDKYNHDTQELNVLFAVFVPLTFLLMDKMGQLHPKEDDEMDPEEDTYL